MGEFAGKVRRQNTGAAAAAGEGTLKRLNFTRQQRRSFTTAAAGAGGGECADPGAGVTTLCRTPAPGHTTTGDCLHPGDHLQPRGVCDVVHGKVRSIYIELSLRIEMKILSSKKYNPVKALSAGMSWVLDCWPGTLQMIV